MSNANSMKGSSSPLLMDFGKWEEMIRIQVETALTMLVERTVKVSLEPPELFNLDDIDRLFPEGLIRVSLPINPLINWHFLFSNNLAAVMAGLIASGEESVKYEPYIHNATLGDMMLQTTAMLEAELKHFLGDKVEIGEPDVDVGSETYLARLEGQESLVVRINIDKWGEGLVLKVLEIQTPGKAAKKAYKKDVIIQRAPGKPKPLAARKTTPPSPPPRRREPSPPLEEEPPTYRRPTFEDFEEPEVDKKHNGHPRNLDILLDISLPITIELGRTKMLVRDVLELGPGSVIELDKLSGEPVDLYANDKLFAHGEVVVIEENFGVRITELLQIDERLNALKG